MPKTPIQRRYDHRLCDLVRSTDDIGHAIGRGVPRSTARGWLTSKTARESRMEVNRTASCTTYEQLTSISSQTDPTAAATVLTVELLVSKVLVIPR